MNAPQEKSYQLATFAGGCFWCMVKPFDQMPGIMKVVSGYTGGSKVDPTYQEVCSGTTGHCEAVQVTYDPQLFPYTKLLDIFWQQIDPTDAGGQFYDRGPTYKTVIFYHSEEQKRQAEASKKALAESGRFAKPIATEILPAVAFYPAEDYHQDYYKKNPDHYYRYSLGSGRGEFIAKHWKKDLKNESLKTKLTPIQYEVTQNSATEPPFQNPYWDNTKEGIYVDIISGEPLFTSLDKFDSGCGWPSFKQPLDISNIQEKADLTYGMRRVEVRSKNSDSHLGHVFDDGPLPTGKRYCINSAAIRFIAKEDLEQEGYGEFFGLFK